MTIFRDPKANSFYFSPLPSSSSAYEYVLDVFTNSEEILLVGGGYPHLSKPYVSIMWYTQDQLHGKKRDYHGGR